jgi:hypothetical protein
MTTPSASSKTPIASAPPPPPLSSESSSEWRKRKVHTDDGCQVFQVQVVEQPAGKTFLPKPRPDVQERIECGFEEEGERVVCNLNALLGKGGMELVEAVVELPESPPARSPSAARAARAIATRRGGQRWSSLVSAPTSRVARILRPVLGEALWCRFVLHANAYYKDAFVAAFDGPVLSCVGRGDTPCPRGFCIDLSVSADGLRHLHLDHEQDLQVTCDMWKEAWQAGPQQTWHDGVDRDLLCHLLFGVRADPTHGSPMVRFRCGPLFFGSCEGYCHQLNMPHYRGVREVRVCV